MEHRLVQAQTQRLMLTQKMQQALQILQLSSLELEQFIQQELETNPVLDINTTPPGEIALVNSALGSTGETNTDLFDESFDLDAYASQWLAEPLPVGDDKKASTETRDSAYEDSWDDHRREGTDMSFNPDLEGRQRFHENNITREESFSSLLMTQLRLVTDDEAILRIGERILGDINARGYFTGDCEELATELGVEVSEVVRVLTQVIQRFDPVGVGARDVIECLLLQIDDKYPAEPQLRHLVEFHLEDLERRQIPKIAKAMGISPERVEELKRLVSTLNPWPGNEYSTEPTQYVTPDVGVDKIDDEYVVYLIDGRLPELSISPEYRRMIKDTNVDRPDRTYLREKVESAKWLINNVAQRQRTILRIARAIMEVQTDFLDKGPEFLKPLTLQEIADKVGVHEATVSRTTRGKYIQTPQGIFEMKYFFSPGLRHDSGESQSSKSVQTLVQRIVDEEDKKHPLSDQKISELLKKQGLNVARRTVTKYREALNIPSTTQRKTY